MVEAVLLLQNRGVERHVLLVAGQSLVLERSFEGTHQLQFLRDALLYLVFGDQVTVDEILVESIDGVLGHETLDGPLASHEREQARWS